MFGVSKGRGDAGIGNRDNDVGGNVRFARELAAHLVTRLLYPAAEDFAVGARKVNLLKDATRLRDTGGVLAAGQAVAGDHDQLAGKIVADVFGAEQIEGAGFRSEDDGVGRAMVADAADGKRAEAARIARGEDAIAREHDDGECAFKLGERVGNGIDER